MKPCALDLMVEQRTRMAPGNAFARMSASDSLKTELLREQFQTAPAEEVKHARRVVFVPAFSEDTRGEAGAIPCFHQPEATLARESGGPFQRAAWVREVAEHLNHADQIVSMRSRKIFESPGVKAEVQPLPSMRGHGLVGLEAFRVPTCSAKSIAQEPARGAHVEKAARLRVRGDTLSIAARVLAQERAFARIVRVTGAASEEIRIDVDARDVVRRRLPFGKAMAAADALANGEFHAHAENTLRLGIADGTTPKH